MRLQLAIPNFKGARYLRHTLESLRAQDGLVQWWMQDACSPDASVAIAEEFREEHDRIIVEPDKGQTDALNRAFARMGGDIIGWINSDDCLLPGAAAAVLDAFARNPDVDIIYGEVDWIDADGRVTGHHAGGIDTLEQMLDIYGYWWNSRQWVQPEVFFRRSLWDKAGPLDTRYHLAFDYAFWVRCMEVGARPMRLPQTLVQFRKHADQKSVAARDAANEIRTIVRESLQRGAPVTPAFRRRLVRQLDYDGYQSGQDWPDLAQRPGLARMLMRRPDWLLLPEVRRRLCDTFGRALRLR